MLHDRLLVWRLTSFIVAKQSFMEYVLPAVQELADARTTPVEIAYDSLLTLARQVRSRPELYETSEKDITQTQERIGWLEPVKSAETVTSK